MAEKKFTKQLFVTGRVSYVNVFRPRPKGPNEPKDSPDKYGLAILVPKNDKAQIKAIEAAFLEVAKENFGPTADKLMKGGKIATVWRDGDLEEGKQGYEGHMFFNASASRKPGVVDVNRQAIDDPEAFYSGCYAQVSVTIYSYTTPKSGVTAGLNNIRKIKDGERLDGRVAAEAEEWPTVEGEDEDGGDDGSDLV